MFGFDWYIQSFLAQKILKEEGNTSTLFTAMQIGETGREEPDSEDEVAEDGDSEAGERNDSVN